MLCVTALWSRSTWACELKLYRGVFVRFKLCHAPRERVSWNDFMSVLQIFFCVTLHVSVWVEISSLQKQQAPPWVTLHVSVWVEIADVTATYDGVTSRSTWACELKFTTSLYTAWRVRVTLHVSVWVEMNIAATLVEERRSRSTWACELKWCSAGNHRVLTMSRSTWACELKSLLLRLAALRSPSRSTWACELKCVTPTAWKYVAGHAPRERVSWNQKEGNAAQDTPCHAPRERVSWNINGEQGSAGTRSHAPRERVSWNLKLAYTFSP